MGQDPLPAGTGLPPAHVRAQEDPCGGARTGCLWAFKGGSVPFGLRAPTGKGEEKGRQLGPVVQGQSEEAGRGAFWGQVSVADRL